MRRKCRDHSVLAWWSFACFTSGAVGSLFGGVLGRILFGG